METILEEITGSVTCDAWCMVKADIFERIYRKTRKVFMGVRKNMKRVMTSVQAKLFRDRSIIESDWSVLKGRMRLDTHIARGINGLFRHYFYCLSIFLLFGSSSELNDRYRIA